MTPGADSAEPAPHRGHGRRLETMTWLEAEPILAADPVVVLPLGARTKEHGPHLPLNNDWLMAEYLAARVLVERPILLLPTLQYGFYPAFREYPGSISLSLPTSRDMVLDIVRSLARHGPTRFYVLNTGISTLKPLRACRDILAREGVTLAFTHIGEAKRDAVQRWSEQARGSHADEVETSMMLVMAPEVVRLDRAVRDDAEEARPGPLRRQAPVEDGVHSPSGSWGDPTLATRQKGEAFVAALVAGILADLDRLLESDG